MKLPSVIAATCAVISRGAASHRGIDLSAKPQRHVFSHAGRLRFENCLRVANCVKTHVLQVCIKDRFQQTGGVSIGA